MKETPIHPIQTVARRTGLTADVIRAWERRYCAVVPKRSDTKRRLYSESDVERLLLLRRATLAGRRIGDVAQMPTDQLGLLVESDETAAANAPRSAQGAPSLSATSPVAYCKALLDAVSALDTESLDAVLRRAARELSTDVLMSEVISPVVEAIGDGWADGSMGVSNEHLATAVIRSLLDNLRSAQSRSFSGPEIVIATPSGQVHELGALMASVGAAADGWRVTYLGADIPAADIALAAEAKRAKLVALSLIYPEADEAIANELVQLRRLLPRDVALVVGGRAAGSYAETLNKIGARILANGHALTVVLSGLRDRARVS